MFNLINATDSIFFNLRFWVVLLFLFVSQVFMARYGSALLQTVPLSWTQIIVCTGIGLSSVVLGLFAKNLPQRWFRFRI